MYPIPILFNTQMVQAILDGRKTVTRRLIKPQPKSPVICHCGTWQETQPCANGVRMFPPPYKPGDILYVRETWAHPSSAEIEAGADPNMYLYKADKLQPAAWDKWHPSIHMPKDAARLFLRVTTVRMEQLQDIFKDPSGPNCQIVREGCRYGCDFIATWQNTVKKVDWPVYGYDANPWVWVIEFEVIPKPA